MPPTPDITESALLRAIRDKLRAQDAFDDSKVGIEPDESPPASIGDLYVIVKPGGVRPGPAHRSSGGVRDKIVAVEVHVLMRLPKHPRDRRTDIFMANLNSLNAYLAIVEDAIDFKYDVLTDANQFIEDEIGSTEGFIMPPVYAGETSTPRTVAGEHFSARPGETDAGMTKAIRFDDARRIWTRS
jgi:hypothetical protein